MVTATKWKIRAKRDRKYRFWINLKNRIILYLLELKDKVI